MTASDWRGRIADISTSQRDLPDILLELERHQLQFWPDLRQGIESLRQVEYRDLTVDGAPILLQHNPRRIVSSSARVDIASIAARPCFLCPENLPNGEQGVRFGDDFVLVYNPMPVLEKHIVAVHVDHIPQRIAKRIDRFLELISALGEEFAVIYNGPRCGASAPDHLHFQAVSPEKVPILKSSSYVKPVKSLAVRVSVSIGKAPRFLLVDGSDKDRITKVLQALLQVLCDVSNQESDDDEPMINLLGTTQAGAYRIFVFPRSKHRPDSFYKSGEEQRMISPAALDLAGVVVAPRKQDFDRVTDVEMSGIFEEVTLGASQFERLTGSHELRKWMNHK